MWNKIECVIMGKAVETENNAAVDWTTLQGLANISMDIVYGV